MLSACHHVRPPPPKFWPERRAFVAGRYVWTLETFAPAFEVDVGYDPARDSYFAVIGGRHGDPDALLMVGVEDMGELPTVAAPEREREAFAEVRVDLDEIPGLREWLEQCAA